MPPTVKLIPIYTSKGDVGGFLQYPNLFSPQGEWIGWVTYDRNVYSVRGNFVGKITNEPRILREREFRNEIHREIPPRPPHSIQPPLRVPLAPLMAEISQNLIDVLEEAPDLLPPMGFDMLQEDAG
jgi:hypothetical protein